MIGDDDGSADGTIDETVEIVANGTNVTQFLAEFRRLLVLIGDKGAAAAAVGCCWRMLRIG